MNNSDPASANADALPKLAQAILTNRPHWLVSLVGLLTSISACITTILGFSAYVDLLPVKFSVWVGFLFLALLSINKGIIHFLDLADNGVADGSVKAPTNILPFAALLISCLILPSCNLSQAQWIAIGKAAGMGALQGAIPAASGEYANQQQIALGKRQATSAKGVQSVQP